MSDIEKGTAVGVGHIFRSYLLLPMDAGLAVAVGHRFATTLAIEWGYAVGVGHDLVAEQWYAVFEVATGDLISIGTIIGDLPGGYDSVEIFGKPGRDVVWDKASHSFVAREGTPDADLVDTIMAAPGFPDVSTAERIAFRDVLEETIPTDVRYG